MWQGHSSNITSVAYHYDLSCFATGAEDGTLRLWEFQVRNPLCPGAVLHYALAPSRHVLVKGTLHAVANDLFCCMQTMAFIADLAGHAADVTSLAFQSSGPILPAHGVASCGSPSIPTPGDPLPVLVSGDSRGVVFVWYGFTSRFDDTHSTAVCTL